MKKTIFLRGALGFPLGIAIGYVITIVFSLVWGQGYYAPCVPELVSAVGSEIAAVVLQTVLCGLLGTVFSASSVIWEVEHWSIVKQTGLYFSIGAVVMMPIAYFLYWMERSLKGVLSYFGIFVAIFFAIWISEYFINKHTVAKINSKLH